MKFGKRLRTQVDETLPEWRDSFISYKDLKKRLKSLSAPECFTEAAVEHSAANGEGDKSVADILKDELGEAGGAGVMPLGSSGKLHGSQDVAEKTRTQHQEREGQQTLSTSLMNSGWSRRVFQGKEMAAAAAEEVAGSVEDDSNVAPEEGAFVKMLYSELEKFNNFFIEKEEEFVIRLQDLKERVDALRSRCNDVDVASCVECGEEVNEVRKAIVTFHGEMVLLENYSHLNYIGLCKILKKHDKRAGNVVPLRTPFIEDVLHQPFYMTELLSKLVKECEGKLQFVFPKSAFRVEPEKIEAEAIENGLPKADNPSGDRAEPSTAAASMADEEVDSIYRSTLAALRSLREIRGSKSLQLNGGEARPLCVPLAGSAPCCPAS